MFKGFKFKLYSNLLFNILFGFILRNAINNERKQQSKYSHQILILNLTFLNWY